MAGRLAAERPVPFREPFQDVAITDVNAFETNSKLAQRDFQTKVAHMSAYDITIQPAIIQTRLCDHVKNLIAVDDLTVSIDHNHAITVAIERDPQVRPVDAYRTCQSPRIGRTKPVVDIQTVWLGPDGNDISADLVQYIGSDVVGRTMRAIHDNLKAAKIQFGRDRALAELDVAPTRILETRGLAETG